MNESPRIRDIKRIVHSETDNLRILVVGMSGMRAEEPVKAAISKLESAWEDLLLAERLA